MHLLYTETAVLQDTTYPKSNRAQEEVFMRIAVYTLGCRTNQAESAGMAEYLRRRGHSVADAGERADAVIVNTCTVTAAADRKSRSAVRRLRARHPGAVLAVCGCLPQTEKLDIPGIDLVGGTADREESRRNSPQPLRLLQSSSGQRGVAFAPGGFRPSRGAGRRTGRRGGNHTDRHRNIFLPPEPCGLGFRRLPRRVSGAGASEFAAPLRTGRAFSGHR